MTTMLERVKEIKVVNLSRAEVTEEEIEVGLAWMREDITITQIIKSGVLGKGNLARIATVLREAYRKGKIIEVQQ